MLKMAEFPAVPTEKNLLPLGRQREKNHPPSGDALARKSNAGAGGAQIEIVGSNKHPTRDDPKNFKVSSG
jgi:hypothetical protein